MTTPQLTLKNLPNLPDKPGVYLFKRDHDILYIGKAKSLSKRVKSYFNSSVNSRPWVASMMPIVTQIDTIVTKNEVEAFILESNFIKQYRPKYNIHLIDDKNYPYIKYVHHETIPRFEIVRRIKPDKARYFGPYLSAWNVNNLLDLLRDTYGIHISSKVLKANQPKACFNCALNNHSCPMHSLIALAEYKLRVSQALGIITGQNTELSQIVKNKMTEYASLEQFELAARFRDRYLALTSLPKEKQATHPTLSSFDCIGVAIYHDLSAVSLHQIREGKLIGQETYYFSLPISTTAGEIVSEFISRFYIENLNHPINNVYYSVKLGNTVTISESIRRQTGQKLLLKQVKRGDKYASVHLANLNAETKLSLKLLGRDKEIKRLIRLKEILALEEIPDRIETVDISNLGSSETVGAITCFISGKRQPDLSRRYKIKTVVGQNDFAMIAEVVARRFNDDSLQSPDLFVVDGDFKQLDAALKALTTTKYSPKKIIALAKDPDRIFLPGKKRPFPVKKNDPGLLMLSEARDETHRFVISYQRKRQLRRSLGEES